VSFYLEIELVNGRRYRYGFPTAERRSQTVDLVIRIWESEKTRSVRLTDPTGATVTLNTSHIARLVEV
jgi:hypothetical protein